MGRYWYRYRQHWHIGTILQHRQYWYRQPDTAHTPTDIYDLSFMMVYFRITFFWDKQKCKSHLTSEMFTDVVRGLCSGFPQNVWKHYDKRHSHVKFDHLMLFQSLQYARASILVSAVSAVSAKMWYRPIPTSDTICYPFRETICIVRQIYFQFKMIFFFSFFFKYQLNWHILINIEQRASKSYSSTF